MTPNPEQGALRDWMVRNPQRINLGRIGLVLIKDDGSRAGIGDLTDPVQRLDLWTGTATSRYSIDGREVVVTTVGHPEKDAVAVRIESEKVADGTVGISLRFPFPSNTEFGSARPTGTAPEGTLRSFRPGHIWPASTGSSTIRITMSTCSGTPGAVLRRTQEHCYELIPATDAREISFVVCFDKIVGNAAVPTFAQTRSASARHWREFWGGRRCHRPLGEFRSSLARAGTAGRALPIRDGRQRGRIPPGRRRAALSITAGTASTTTR